MVAKLPTVKIQAVAAVRAGQASREDPSGQPLVWRRAPRDSARKDPSSHMDSPTCPNCKAPTRPYLRARDYNRRVGTDVFSYRRCPSCGLIYLHPRPSDLGRYYPEGYYVLASDPNELAQKAELERYKIEIVERFHAPGTLIEIGPGAGGFAYLAKQAGFNVSVIEMSEASCEYLRDTIGVTATCTSNELSALQASEPVDVIALWHVIEHLEDPFELIRAAAEKLRPGGVLVVAAPNPRSLQFRILGKRWAHVDAPRHAYLIPPEVLTAVAEGSGLQLLFETTLDTGSIGWNAFGWQVSLQNLFKGESTRRYATNAAARITTAMQRFEEREGRGSGYTLVFGKDRS